MSKSCILIVTYERLFECKRLSDSLLKANFFGGDVDLIVSIDFKSKKIQDDIGFFFEEVEWKHGEKYIIKREQRLGLHQHVLNCGDLVSNYDFLIMLEDDVVVAPGFYSFVNSAMSFYEGSDRIGGVSLYTPMVNEAAGLSFIPEKGEHDIFMIQYAQSWGQAWSKKMWRDFRTWYANVEKPLVKSDFLPENVLNWPESSWKKYFICYLVEKNKFFLYPYFSLSSNCGSVGTHNRKTSSRFQVPLSRSLEETFRFAPEKSLIKYDVFYERLGLYFDGDSCSEIEFDIYGLKKKFKNSYVVSSQILKCEKIGSLPLSFRPQECNFRFIDMGDDIFIYRIRKEHLQVKIDRSRSYRQKIKIIKYHSTLGRRNLIFLAIDVLFHLFFGKIHYFRKLFKRKI